MKISGTKVLEEPQTFVEQRKQATGIMLFSKPTPPPPDQPILIAVVRVSPPAPVAEPTATQKPAVLPKTGGKPPS